MCLFLERKVEKERERGAKDGALVVKEKLICGHLERRGVLQNTMHVDLSANGTMVFFSCQSFEARDHVEVWLSAG
jgi:hypothetical protein